MVNTSGHYPTRDLVLVEPEQEVEHKGTVIIIPDSAKTREALNQVYGRIVAIGEVAFSAYDKNYGSNLRDKATPGTRIMFAKYHGIVITGKDKKQYRLITDDDVGAWVDDDVQKELDV